MTKVVKDNKEEMFSKIIGILEKDLKEMKDVPEDVKIQMVKLVKAALSETSMRIQFPVNIFKENDWFIATTPVIDVCAQGKTEEEAVESLKEMIDDYMTDPDTQKPSARTVMRMEFTMKNIPISLPIAETKVGC
jgi:predicted RNase H-like HicB family nuclease